VPQQTATVVTATSPPAPVATATPTEAQAWDVSLRQLDEVWDRDWNQVIAVIAEFRRRYPEYPPAKYKLYDAQLNYGKQLVNSGRPLDGAKQFEEARKLLPERPEAPGAILSLTPTPIPVGTVLYEANWQSGTDKWLLDQDWTSADGNLVYVGSRYLGDSFALAPYSAPIDCAVEAEMQAVLRQGYPNAAYYFGVFLRQGQGGTSGYGTYAGDFKYGKLAGIHRFRPEGNPISIEEIRFDDANSWHTYRLEVKGSTIKLFIDGIVRTTTVDTAYRNGSSVGIWARQNSPFRLNIRKFRVIAV